MFGLGMQELIIIMIIFLLLFGAKSLPGLARGVGDSIRELKKAAKDITDDGP